MPRFKRVMVTQRGFKSLKFLIYLISMVEVCCKHYILCEVASKTMHFHYFSTGQ